MIPMFLGLTCANLLLLASVFTLGFFGIGAENEPTRFYALHIGLAIGAGFFTVLTHLAVFTYFMGTSKWLLAASDKSGLPHAQYVAPAGQRKRRAMMTAMAAIVITMITMFAGAGADPTMNPLWPAEVHMVLGMLTLMVNLIAPLVEFQLIRGQSRLMDDALAHLNAPQTNVAPA